MRHTKTHHDVWGFEHNCPNYQECPVCYGCRNYDSSFMKCRHCAEAMKKNVCNRKLHRPDLIARLITREVIDLREKKV